MMAQIHSKDKRTIQNIGEVLDSLKRKLDIDNFALREKPTPIYEFQIVYKNKLIEKFSGLLSNKMG